MDNNQIAPSSGINGILQKNPVILQILRFGAIGVLNTALNFIVLNFISTAFGINSGLSLGLISVVGFILATFQSYYWNRSWAFAAGAGSEGLWKNFLRLVIVGALGAVAFVAVLFGAHKYAAASYFVVVLLLFLVLEVLIIHSFGLSASTSPGQNNRTFAFWAVSIIGALINGGLIWLITNHFSLSPNPNLNKNIAAILATCASLIWNFIGYKVLVFKD